MDNKISNDLNEIFEYSVKIRRKLHMYPEIGFDLEKTVALVKSELEKMGIEYTEKYGKSSVVAQIGSGERIIAFRADMDALPIKENADVPFASKIPGRMHACGHDSHTAVLLGVAKYLKMVEDKLNLRVRLIFQPSEESVNSGGKMLTESGVMEGVSHILAAHCDNAIESGTLGICPGDFIAACAVVDIKFFGRSSHVGLPQNGIDAIAMANDAYIKIKKEVSKIMGDSPYVWSVGKISGGTSHNIISDFCEMNVSFRYYNSDIAERVKTAVFEISNSVADDFGGKVEIEWNNVCLPIHNNEEITENFKNIAEKNGIKTEKVPIRLTSEDFCWYVNEKPGTFFRFGTRNEALGCTYPVHSPDFKLDENGMKSALKAFVSYALAFEN